MRIGMCRYKTRWLYNFFRGCKLSPATNLTDPFTSLGESLLNETFLEFLSSFEMSVVNLHRTVFAMKKHTRWIFRPPAFFRRQTSWIIKLITLLWYMSRVTVYLLKINILSSRVTTAHQRSKSRQSKLNRLNVKNKFPRFNIDEGMLSNTPHSSPSYRLYFCFMLFKS